MTEPQTSRRWDGNPETASDRRFFDLRDAGYHGPIDQDGYPVPVLPGSYWEQNARPSTPEGQTIAGVLASARSAGLTVDVSDIVISDGVPTIDGMDAFEWILGVGGQEDEQ
ncbi:hypothetical protein ACWDUN_29855 [Mycobacterium sp. NPDC003323]